MSYEIDRRRNYRIMRDDGSLRSLWLYVHQTENDDRLRAAQRNTAWTWMETPDQATQFDKLWDALAIAHAFRMQAVPARVVIVHGGQ